MLQEEIGQSAYAELLQQAVRIDKISGETRDRELLRGLSALRRCLGEVLSLLADRYEQPGKSRRQLVHERRFPWDKC